MVPDIVRLGVGCQNVAQCVLDALGAGRAISGVRAEAGSRRPPWRTRPTRPAPNERKTATGEAIAYRIPYTSLPEPVNRAGGHGRGRVYYSVSGKMERLQPRALAGRSYERLWGARPAAALTLAHAAHTVCRSFWAGGIPRGRREARVDDDAEPQAEIGGVQTHYLRPARASRWCSFTAAARAPDAKGNWEAQYSGLRRAFSRAGCLDMIGFGHSERPDPKAYSYGQTNCNLLQNQSSSRRWRAGRLTSSAT